LINQRFTEEVETYTVLLLHLDEFQPTTRDLPTGFTLLDPAERSQVRDQEKRLLQRLFDDWEIPYSGKLSGWREDSPFFVVCGQQLVSGLYLCDKNEFDDDPIRGQVHYVFTQPEFQGRGIYSVAFREAMRKAQSWGLKEIYLNSDRYLLPEVYLRWGARPWKQLTKSSRLPRNAFGRWLRQIGRSIRTLRDGRQDAGTLSKEQ
jgi:GNAT superfamily N-acetyltransferase